MSFYQPDHVHALLADSGLPKFLWKEALKFTMWIRNRTTTHHLDGKTPYEVFHGVRPDVGDIHLWGSRVWVQDLTAGKLDPRGREGRFIGYDAESKGYRIYWPNSRSIGVERGGQPAGDQPPTPSEPAPDENLSGEPASMEDPSDVTPSEPPVRSSGHPETIQICP